MQKFMLKLFLIVALFSINFSVHAQSGNFLWAEQAGGQFSDVGNAIAVDGSGNSIVTGVFEGTPTFGDTTLTGTGILDIFIAKYDGMGNLLWAVQAGGTGFDESNGIATDGSGNIFVTGAFEGTATFGDTTLTSVGGEDIFIAKYDGNGNFLWAAQAGGTDFEKGRGIATDGSGNSIVIGRFVDMATFGNTTLTSTGFQDIFIAKYDGDGNFLWAAQAGGEGDDDGFGIATDSSGNSIVTGAFADVATFGDTTLTSVGFGDIFIAKYDSDGNFLWASQAGGPDFDSGAAIAADNSGNGIVTGAFNIFGPSAGGTATFGDTTLTSAGFEDIFIAKYDVNGNFLWVAQAGGTSLDEGRGIATDGLGNSIVTGAFNNTATFGDRSLTSAGSQDIFIVTYDGDGNLLRAEQGGGTEFDFAFALATDGSGNSVLTGFWQGATTQFGNITLTSAGNQDIFIAQLGSEVTTVEAEFTIPQSFNLSQNYPNPFNPSTTIEFSIPQTGFVTLKVYNISGKEVATLVSDKLPAGSYKYDWDARELATGMYFYRLDTVNSVMVRRALYLK